MLRANKLHLGLGKYNKVNTEGRMQCMTLFQPRAVLHMKSMCIMGVLFVMPLLYEAVLGKELLVIQNTWPETSTPC